ncbi:putative protein N(5)-glutamine methyltransferase [Plantibacter sp. YIM 135347]|uniref:putative protein N(5)-glutamine methyltransferase n=1 Tax=Plantibacter sp. YIM 135347 TaxID=3423919 RepID=UPI003D32B427
MRSRASNPCGRTQPTRRSSSGTPEAPQLTSLTHADLVGSLRAAGCVFAEDEAELLLAEARSPGHLEEMLTLRVDGLPLEHVLGWAAFRGLRILVDSRVFVPRRRTELLVEETVRIAPHRATVVDLCCGTGAVATALLNELTDARVIAADIDPAAVASARRNLEARGGTVLQGDLFDPLPRELRGTVDVIVANAPYVPTEAIQLMPQEAREHEDIVALDGGEDGLDIQRRVVLGVTEWLRPGGWLIIETSESQSLLTASLFTAVGLSARIVRSEELDATAVVGHLPLD